MKIIIIHFSNSKLSSYLCNTESNGTFRSELKNNLQQPQPFWRTSNHRRIKKNRNIWNKDQYGWDELWTTGTPNGIPEALQKNFCEYMIWSRSWHELTPLCNIRAIWTRQILSKALRKYPVDINSSVTNERETGIILLDADYQIKTTGMLESPLGPTWYSTIAAEITWRPRPLKQYQFFM